ncbi:hypothetical protein [Spirillospora sp. CA-128828]|uniref:hypothetical protein n=1 Tax=Spirillospora sp. CA-128828 TaxID=3240033 RepID=UPI003D8EBA55
MRFAQHAGEVPGRGGRLAPGRSPPGPQRDRRSRASGYHWDVRTETSYIGTYFTAHVNEQGLVEFGGGIDGPHLADPDGWRAVVADFNDFGHGKRIRLWE